MRKNAFTLIELLIVLAIISILSGLIYPQYSDHLIKVRRNLAAVSLYDLAAKMEEFYSKNNKYSGASIDDLGLRDLSVNKYYAFTLQTFDNAFLLRAEPIGEQGTKDISCGALILDGVGNKNISGSGSAEDCWR